MRQQQTQPKEYDCARLSQVRSLLAGYPAAALCYQITLVTILDGTGPERAVCPAWNGKLGPESLFFIDRNSCS